MLAWTLQSFGPLFGLVIVCAALYLLPGYALLHILWTERLDQAQPLTVAERFAAALIVGFALPPLLLFVAWLVGLKWSPGATWIYILTSAAILIIPIAVRLTRGLHPAPRWRRVLTWDVGLLVTLTLIALAVRLYTMRDYRAGLFGDSYHHTLIAQLLLDNNGLFDSYQPYAPLSSFTYHFGFHADAAFYSWLTGLPARFSVLIIGQVLNTAAVPAAFLLTSRVIGSARTQPAPDNTLPIEMTAALWAAVLTGFVSLMPAYYVNWGRYTQLAGQVVLPIVVVGWIELLNRAVEMPLRAQARAQARMIVLCSVLTASLMLTHYIVTIFAAVMVGVYVLALIVRSASWRAAGRIAVPAALGAVLALIIALPWIRNTLTGGLSRNTSLMVSGAVGADRIASYAALTPITPFYLKGWTLILAGIGVLIALAQRCWQVMIFAVWSFAFVLLVTPQTLGLPGAGVVDQFAVYIALYVTVLPLCGYALAAIQGWTVAQLIPICPRLAHMRLHLGLAATAMVAISLWGVTWLQNVSEPSRQMLTPSDEAAMTWIRDNLPADAHFLVNSFPAYGGTLIAGTDGGWWIPLMTGRQTNLPPMVYGSEQTEQPDFYERTNALPEAMRGRSRLDGTPVSVILTTPERVQLLRTAGIRYIYSGANQTPGPDRADQIDTAALRQSNDFRLIYDRDGVEIFELVQ